MKLPFKKNIPYKEMDKFSRIRAIILGIVFVLLLFLVLFLYRDFYQTIVQANEVIVLKQEVALQNIDIIGFNQIFAIHQYKRENILPDKIPDPFDTEAVNLINTIDNDVIEDSESAK